MTRPIQIMPRPNLTIEERAALVAAHEKAGTDIRLSAAQRAESLTWVQQLKAIQARRVN